MRTLTLGSLFDGIGGWILAAKHAGVKPIWSSEIEKFPCAVTAYHFPEVKQLGDITKIDGGKIEPVDIICAGSPCQDLSVAGKREGLDGERSGLFRTAVGIVRCMRRATNGKYPRYFVWENVPGAFSSNRGMDFRAVLEEISQTEISMPKNNKWANAGMVEWDGGSLAWRVLDAQYWGVPQRRKRIFLVADFRGRSAGEILFERESVPRHTSAGEGEREGTAAGTESGVGDAVLRMRSGKAGGGKGALVSYGKSLTLTANTNDQTLFCGTLEAGHSHGVAIYDISHRCDVVRKQYDTLPCMTARYGTGGNNVPVVHTFADKASTLRGAGTIKHQADAEGRLVAHCIAGNTIDRKVQNGGNGKGTQEELAYTLNTMDRHAVFTQQRIGEYAETGKAKTVMARDYKSATDLVTSIDCRNMNEQKGVSGTLQAKKSGGYSLNYQNPVRIKKSVRRLTPTECERLQGLPDGYTLIDDKSCSDSARYRALGNGMAQPCADYVIKRIAEVQR